MKNNANLNTIATLDDDKSHGRRENVLVSVSIFLCCPLPLPCTARRVNAIVDVMWKEEVPNGKAVIQQGDLQVGEFRMEVELKR